jgi:hypothetical protein
MLGVLLAVGVRVGVNVGLGVRVCVGVLVGVRVGVLLGVGVMVGVLADPLPTTTTSCGWVVPSREYAVKPSVLSIIRRKLYVPSLATRAVTLYSSQEFGAVTPKSSMIPVVAPGWLVQVMPPVPDSIHELLVP